MTLRPLDFDPILTARFIERPNRFLVRCRLPRKGVVEAHLPTSGRNREILLPDVKLYLTSNPPSSTRRTRFTVLAAERHGVPIFLHTHANNRVAEFLLRNRLVPGLENAEIVRAEAPVGRSRFDFLLRENGRDLYCEVKSVTLFQNRIAMFPDAVTERGRKHLLELADLHERGAEAAALFLCHSPDLTWFMPDYHTDIAFSRTFLNLRDRLRMLPLSLDWQPDMTLSDHTPLLEIPWDYLKREARDGGAYALILRLDADRAIEVGGLGAQRFRKGYYLYVGSAMRNLSQRLARHSRLRKKMHWHIDYLRAAAASCTALAIRGSTREECVVARAMAALFQPGPEGFGSSDCDCPRHLFYSPGDPERLPKFQETLLNLRLKPPHPVPATRTGSPRP